MSGQEKFQLVSTGKTLRGKTAEAVLQEAAKAFSLPLPQARRLMVKGWVIKDRLTSQQVVEYRSRLQTIGLRVEVFPAGKFDNRALIAKLQFAQKRRARSGGAATASAPPAEKKGGEGTAGARAQLAALFGDLQPSLGESVAGRVQLMLGFLPAALVPALFLSLLCLCGYATARALWQILLAFFDGAPGFVGLAVNTLSIALAGFVAALLALPFFSSRRLYPVEPGAKALDAADARGLHLLLELLAEKTQLPSVERIYVTAGVEVVSDPGLAEIVRQRLPLSIGLGAVLSLDGRELLALVARALGTYRGRLGGIVAWLVLDTADRLQRMQWALENERSILCASGEASGLQKPLHALLCRCGRPALALVDRLFLLHRALTAPVARRIERRGDAWAAQLLGSGGFVAFAEKWHQLVYAELMVGEINREAAVAGQRLRDYPDAVRWMRCSLDREIRSNIELAMAQPGDPWDRTQAADSERIARAEALALEPLLQRAFSARKLFDDLEGLSDAVSAAVAGEGCRAVENSLLLCASQEVEQAAKIVGDYFNQLPPRFFLPMEAPAGEELRSLDLQGAIDWLRGKLVELRDLNQRLQNLRRSGAVMRLGAGLVRAQEKIQPQAYSLSGATPAAADESIRDNRARRAEAQEQVRQIFRVFYLRVRRALESLPAGEREASGKLLDGLAAYSALEPRLEKLEHYTDILGLMIDRLSLAEGQRALVQKYFALAAQELEGVFSAVHESEPLRKLALADALRERGAGSPAPELPVQRQELVDALQAMELKCKSAAAAIVEHYRIQLAKLLKICLKRERALNVKPLRLIRVDGQ